MQSLVAPLKSFNLAIFKCIGQIMATRGISFMDMPIIIILGSTATGKSKLGIELAKALNGEIISADSMQVYQGLDIITNKVTADEQREVPHHMINIVSPPQEFTVAQFKKLAIETIKDLYVQKKVPIIVGGTNYYIEALLWDFLVGEERDIAEGLQERKQLSTTNSYGEDADAPQSNLSECKDLYERLREVDPRRAEQLHPNNIRKVARSLQIYNNTGKTHSDLLKEQKEKPGSSHLSGPLHFSKALVLWLTCNQEVLDQRISDRMEKMVGEGLKQEISEFYKHYRWQRKLTPSGSTENNANKDIPTSKSTCVNVESVSSDSLNTVSSDVSNVSSVAATTSDIHTVNSTSSQHSIQDSVFEQGLLQAIGYKEFFTFITSTENDLEKLETLFRDGLEKLRKRTIKYSKKQQLWVRNRFLARPGHNVPRIYELSTTNLEKWNENVLQKSLQIANAFIRDDDIPFSPMDKLPLPSFDKNQMHVCKICHGKIIIGDMQWEAHTASKKHRKLTATGKKRKLQADEAVS